MIHYWMYSIFCQSFDWLPHKTKRVFKGLNGMNNFIDYFIVEVTIK